MSDTIERELSDQIATGEFGPDPVLRRGGSLDASWKPVTETVKLINEPPLPTIENAVMETVDGGRPVPPTPPGIPVDDEELFAQRARALGLDETWG